MKKLTLLGYILITLSILVVIAMAVNNPYLWKFVDIVMILITSITGIILIRDRGYT